jgi:hypothetical protein
MQHSRTLSEHVDIDCLSGIKVECTFLRDRLTNKRSFNDTLNYIYADIANRISLPKREEALRMVNETLNELQAVAQGSQLRLVSNALSDHKVQVFEIFASEPRNPVPESLGVEDIDLPAVFGNVIQLLLKNNPQDLIEIYRLIGGAIDFVDSKPFNEREDLYIDLYNFTDVVERLASPMRKSVTIVINARYGAYCKLKETLKGTYTEFPLPNKKDGTPSLSDLTELYSSQISANLDGPKN